MSRRCSPIDLLAAALALADADLDVARLVVLEPIPDARRHLARRADEHHVPDRHRRREVDDPARGHLRAAHARGVAHRARLHMPLRRVQVLDHDLPLARARVEDVALLPAVFAREHLHEIALPDLHCCCHCYRTSGAKLTIFMKFFSRNSRATGPKMRVPRGLRALSMSTAAFSSNAISVPSSRPNGFFVRTTTAFTTSPFLTAPCGAAALTVAVMMSPTRA